MGHRWEVSGYHYDHNTNYDYFCNIYRGNSLIAAMWKFLKHRNNHGMVKFEWRG